MRTPRCLLVVIGLAAANPAYADDPPAPEKPAEPPPAPDKPAEPPSDQPADKPAEPAKPAEPPPVINTTPSPTSSQPPLFEGHDTAVTHQAEQPAGNPKIAVELSLTSGRLADPFVVYRGWTLENGQSVGTRLEANLIGIVIAYELTSMSNTRACGVGCFEGDFGSTKINTLEIGYRYRIGKFGPVRPFVALSVGGALANIGGWSMTSDKTVKGGLGRATVGIEIPLLNKFFASASLGYRAIVVENPLRDKDLEVANQALIGTTVPNGDYAEDAHLISGYVGFGVSL